MTEPVTTAKPMTKKAWMELYGTPEGPSPEETGWAGFSHPTRSQWAKLWPGYRRDVKGKDHA